MRIEVVPRCYLCEGHGELCYRDLRDSLLPPKKDPQSVWTFKKCGQCRLIWMSIRPRNSDIIEAYRNYRQGEKSLSSLNRMEKGLQSAYLKHPVLGKVPILGERLRAGGMYLEKIPKGDLLDVGCGEGHFLAQMKEAGWHVLGSELSEELAQIAREKYLVPVITGPFLEAGFPSEKFDVVTLNHVIEHVYCPITVLQECWRILKPGGRLVVTTPNTESLGHRLFGRDWRGLEPPRHLYLFSHKSLKTVGTSAGFESSSVRSTNRMGMSIYYASKLIQRNGYYQRSMLDIRLLLEGLVYQLYQSGISVLQPEVGEELVLIGTK